MKLSFTLLFLFFFTTAIAQSNSFNKEFNLQSDNDSYLFYGQDRYYTNGLFLNYRFSPESKPSEKIIKRIIGLEIAQKMYTPISGYSPSKNMQDRPFAGYLYAGASNQIFYRNESVVQYGLQLGIVGPAALGKESQELLHKIIGFYKPEGWQYQIKNGFSINANLNFAKPLLKASNLDVGIKGEANIGTVFNDLTASAIFRFGRMNNYTHSAFLNSLIAPTSSTSNNNSEFYLLVQPLLSYRAYDATIEGSLFNNNSEVTFGIKPILFTQLIGVTYATPRFGICYQVLFKTKELKSPARSHQYGIINLSYRFR